MDIRRRGKLLFVCGKMAAGKSTLSKELAAREDAVLLAQDELLVTLFPGEIVDLAAFVEYSSRIQDALAPLVCSLLSKRVSVVLDFPANTRKQRAWFRQLLERADSEHELHLIIASDERVINVINRDGRELPIAEALDPEFKSADARRIPFARCSKGVDYLPELHD